MTPKLTILLAVDDDFPQAEFEVDGEQFSVRNIDGRWVVEQHGSSSEPVSAVEVARGLNAALARLEKMRLPHEAPVEQP